MRLNLEKIKEIYGNDSIYDIQEDIEELINNMKYLEKLGIEDIYNVVETYPYIFLVEEDIFKQRVNKLIENIGIEYLDKLNNNMSLWGNIE